MAVMSANERGEVRQVKLADNALGLEIKHQSSQAQISLYGGQVLSWTPAGEKDVFWLSKTSSYEVGKAIRGGIPLCWPWFGPYKDGGNHGFARQQVWSIDTIEITENGVELVLTWQGADIHPLWPYAVKLSQRLFFGTSFKQTLRIENLTKEEISYTGALHTYFHVSHPSQTQVSALNGIPFYCKLSGQHGLVDHKPNMSGPMDRVYQSSQMVDIIDAGFNRKISINTENTNQWVMWNPGKETAAQMSDIHVSGEDEFFCLEAANTDWHKIAANGEASFSQEITICALDK